MFQFLLRSFNKQNCWVQLYLDIYEWNFYIQICKIYMEKYTNSMFTQQEALICYIFSNNTLAISQFYKCNSLLFDRFNLFYLIVKYMPLGICQFSILILLWIKVLISKGSTNGWEVLLSNLVDGRWWVRTHSRPSVVNVRSFRVFLRNLGNLSQIRIRFV